VLPREQNAARKGGGSVETPAPQVFIDMGGPQTGRGPIGTLLRSSGSFSEPRA